jgi:RimJ/RimL family protein N-acetyltransferase
VTKRSATSHHLRIPPRVQIQRQPLCTPRVVIEPIHTGVYRKLFRAVEGTREFLEPWLPWVPFYDSPDASLRYTEACEADWSAGSALRFYLRFRDEADVIGVITLESCSDLHRHCDLGYWLGKEHTGQGLMTEAAESVIAFAFDTINIHRIRCAAAEENIPSRRVIERLGFIREGVAREAERVKGQWMTHVVYSRLATDPRSLPTPP